MNNFSSKTFFKYILFLIILGLIFFGFLKYFDFKFTSLENQFKKQLSEIQNNISEVENNLNEIIARNEKLSIIDSELLKKYSKVYFLNEHYAPSSLTTIGSNYLNQKGVNTKIHSKVLLYLEKLIDANGADGLSLQILSAYRSFATQKILKESYVMTYGAGADVFSADQGFSEHQLGSVVDFTTKEMNGKLDGFEKTPEYKWLLENAYKYGFVISYPEGNSYYKFEPWHWRFIGVKLATKLHDENKYFYQLDQPTIDLYLADLFE